MKNIINLDFFMMTCFLGLAACRGETEENIKTKLFESDNKATHFFETDDREQLLVIIESIDELSELLEEKKFIISPMYDASFFEEHTPVLYFLSQTYR